MLYGNKLPWFVCVNRVRNLKKMNSKQFKTIQETVLKNRNPEKPQKSTITVLKLSMQLARFSTSLTYAFVFQAIGRNPLCSKTFTSSFRDIVRQK